MKEPGELDALRRAAAISDRVYEELGRQRFVGRTEAELAWWLEQAWHEAGADGPAFDAIVAFGENGARPHAKLRDEPIPEGTLVVVDAGCLVDGYRSDCTRTFFTGEPEGRLRELYDLCLTAQLDALAAVRPGALGKDVDAVSRTAIAEAGMGELYGHGLGHGVGLDVHEEPNMRPSPTRCSSPATSSPSSRGSTSRATSASGSRTWWSSPRTAASGLTTVTKEPVSSSADGVPWRAVMAEIVNTNQFRNGMHIEHRGAVWRIVEFQHVKPGRAAPSSARSSRTSRPARSSTTRSARGRSSRASTPR